jgi:hypothetical protein
MTRRRSRRSRDRSTLLAVAILGLVLGVAIAADTPGLIIIAAIAAAAYVAVRLVRASRPRTGPRPVQRAAPVPTRPAIPPGTGGPVPYGIANGQPYLVQPAPRLAAVPSADEVKALRAQLQDARRSIAKMEDDASRHEELIERIEELTGRRIELHIASLERARGLYGPAMAGKTGKAAKPPRRPA